MVAAAGRDRLEPIEELVRHEAPIRRAPGVGPNALDRFGIVRQGMSHEHGANPRLTGMLGDWVTFFLALSLIPVLYLEETSNDPEVVGAALSANAAIWIVFAADYAVDLWRAPDRGAHVRSHWFDLALIAVSPPLLVPPEAQALRALRALRLFRAFAIVGVAYDRLGRPLTRNAALATVALLFLVILWGGIAITWAEPGAFQNVLRGYGWAITTLVTAGHASPEPRTTAGHAIATSIVVIGLGSFVALAASIAGTRGRRG